MMTGDHAADDALAIARLAALPAVEYDRVRHSEAKMRGCRLTTLDQLVAKARGETAFVADTGRGRRLEVPDIELWPESVDGATLLDELARTIRRHVVLDS